MVQSKVKITFPIEKKVDKKVLANSLSYYPSVCYEIPVYKKPGVFVLTIYFPQFVLAWLALAIYYQTYSVDSRLANIAVLLLAYIAFIPSIRSQMPPVPYITFNDSLIASNLFACLTILLHIILYIEYEPDLSPEKLKKMNKAFVAITCFFLFTPYIILLFLMLKHFCFQKKGFDMKPKFK